MGLISYATYQPKINKNHPHIIFLLGPHCDNTVYHTVLSQCVLAKIYFATVIMLHWYIGRVIILGGINTSHPLEVSEISSENFTPKSLLSSLGNTGFYHSTCLVQHVDIIY